MKWQNKNGTVGKGQCEMQVSKGFYHFTFLNTPSFWYMARISVDAYRANDLSHFLFYNQKITYFVVFFKLQVI